MSYGYLLEHLVHCILSGVVQQGWFNITPVMKMLRFLSASGVYVALDMCALNGKLCCWKLRSMNYGVKH